MRIIRQWSAEADNVQYRVVSEPRAEELGRMGLDVMSLEQFAYELVKLGSFTITRVLGSAIHKGYTL
jgi:hypothetical protein